MLLLSYNGFSFSVILQQVEKETYFSLSLFFFIFLIKTKGLSVSSPLEFNSDYSLTFFSLYPLLFLPFLQLTAFPHSKVSSSKLGYLLPKYFLAICQCFQHCYVTASRIFQFVDLFLFEFIYFPSPHTIHSSRIVNFSFIFTEEGAIFPT